MSYDTNNIQPIIIDADYHQWLQQLKTRYRQAQIKAASRVNEELLRYYWQLGAEIDARGDENRYGTKFFEMLSRDLKELLPNAEGLSASNLKFAVRFYKMYAVESKENCEQPVLETPQPNRQQLVNEFEQVSDEAIFRIPWGHHIQILTKSKVDRQKAQSAAAHRHLHLPHLRPPAHQSADLRPHSSA